MLSTPSPSPSGYSLHPPMSPAFDPMLSPLFPPMSSAAASSSSYSISSTPSSHPSASSQLLSSLQPAQSLLSARSLSVASLSDSFLTDVAIHDANSELSSAHRLPSASHSRSLFAPTTELSSALSSALSGLAHRITQQHELPSSPPASSELTGTQVDSHNSDSEQHDRSFPFHLEQAGPASDASAAGSVSDRTADSAPQTPHFDTTAVARRTGGPVVGAESEKRVARACIHCSASKVKCDNKRPCGRCIRTKRTATCQDIPRRKRTGRSKRRRGLETEEADAAEEEAGHEEEEKRPQPAAAKVEVAQAERKEKPEAEVRKPSALAVTRPTPEEQPEAHTQVVAYASHTLASHEPLSAAYRQPQPHAAPLAQPAYEYHNHAVHQAPLHSHATHQWPAHPHTHSSTFNQLQLQAQSASHSLFSPSAHHASHGHQQQPPYIQPRHTQPAHAAAMLSPTHSSSAASTTAAPMLISPSSSRSPAASPTATAAIPIGQVLSRLRLRLPRAMHRAHGAVIDQFHHWSDLLALRQQQGLAPPAPLLKARQYVYHMLKDAIVALEDEDRQRRAASAGRSSSPPSPLFAPPLQSEYDEMLRLVHHDWAEYLFPSNAAGEDDAGSHAWETKGKTAARTLDAILQRRVVPPTFIIPLLSFPFVTSPPWLSASFAALLGYDAEALSASTPSPLALLHHRQHADIAPLVPAFLSAITARADYYLHSSGWVRRGGETVQLMSSVRVMYAEGTGYPLALMAQFTRREEADDRFAPILARMGNTTAAGAGGSV